MCRPSAPPARPLLLQRSLLVEITSVLHPSLPSEEFRFALVECNCVKHPSLLSPSVRFFFKFVPCTLYLPKVQSTRYKLFFSTASTTHAREFRKKLSDNDTNRALKTPAQGQSRYTGARLDERGDVHLSPKIESLDTHMGGKGAFTQRGSKIYTGAKLAIKSLQLLESKMYVDRKYFFPHAREDGKSLLSSSLSVRTPPFFSPAHWLTSHSAPR